jgi:prohibitin 2
MNPDHTPKLVVVAVIGVLLVILAMSSYTIVPPGHRGVKVTMGKVSPDVMSEGFAWKLPFGVTNVEPVNVQQTTAAGETECFSSDTQAIKVKFSVIFKVVPDKAATLFQNYRGDPYSAIIEPRLQEVLKQTTAKLPAEGLIQKRDEVRSVTLEQLRKRMTEEGGGVLNIVDLSLTDLDISDQVRAAIDRKIVVQEEAKQKEFEKQRETLEAEITLVKARAEADAARMRGESLASNPLILQMEIIKKWNGIAPNVVVLGNGGDGQAGAQIILPVVPNEKRPE